MEERTPGYYWEKVARLYFGDFSMRKKWDLAKRYLGKDELDHLKRLCEEE